MDQLIRSKLYETNVTYHQLDHFVNILMWQPVEPDERSKIAVITMHGGYSREMYHNMMEAIGLRGFTSIHSVSAHSDFPSQITDFKKVVEFAKQLPGIEKIVLMGQSRGASLMSSYQKIAENGIKVFQGPERRLPFPDMEPLIPADGVMFLDANYGFMQMLSMNPALVQEGYATKMNPELDCLNPANGYDPKGSHFSEEFKHKFWAAQVKRYRNLMDMAEERLHLIEKGEGYYLDNEPFYIPECIGTLKSNKLFSLDTSLMSHTHGEWPLIHPDGSITTQIVPSVRIAKDDAERRGLMGSAWPTTVRDFLLSEMKLSDDFGYDEDHFWGIDFESCFTCSSGNVKKISAPLLVMGMTGSYEYIAAEWSYNNAKSEDKTIAFTEGASHGFRTAKETEAYPGQWGDTLATTADFVAQWIMDKHRFI
ncbi:MAG: alpha/beta hydrolase [Oscillospiraceae bacterium]